MDQTLLRLASFVTDKDSRLACAAAVVLAELGPKDAQVVNALETALGRADSVRRPFLIEALGRIGTPQAAAILVPLVEAGGASSDEALRAVAHAGAGALKPLAKLLRKESIANELRLKLAEAIARTGEHQGFAALIAELKDVGTNEARAIREGAQRGLGALKEGERAAWLKQVLKALDQKVFAAHEPSCLVLLEWAGDLRDKDALSALAAFATLKTPPRIRRAALLAVGRLELPPAQRGKLAGKFLPLLSDRDFTHSAEPALEALKDAELGAEHRATLQKLVNSEYPPVRAFAMKALAQRGGSRTIQDLAGCLEHDDPGVRENAAQALTQTPAAAPVIAERLIEMTRGAHARIAARVLQAHASQISPKSLTALSRGYIDLACGRYGKAASDPEARRELDEKRAALFSVLRAAAAEALPELALQEARKLRAAGENVKALALLKSIAGVPGWGSEQRLEQGLAGLATATLDLSRMARNQDPNLRLLEEVLGHPQSDPKALAKTLLKDKALERRVLYYIGHHFCERMQHEREFGKRLLEDLAANVRTPEGKQAKEKLVLEGFAKGRKAGILEERAKVMMAAADLAAESAREEAQRAKREAAAAKAQEEAQRKAEQKKKRMAKRALERNTVIKKSKKKAPKAKQSKKSKAKRR